MCQHSFEWVCAPLSINGSWRQINMNTEQCMRVYWCNSISLFHWHMYRFQNLYFYFISIQFHIIASLNFCFIIYVFAGVSRLVSEVSIINFWMKYLKNTLILGSFLSYNQSNKDVILAKNSQEGKPDLKGGNYPQSPIKWQPYVFAKTCV